MRRGGGHEKMADSDGINYWTKTAVMHTVNSGRQAKQMQNEFIQARCTYVPKKSFSLS